MSSLFLRGYLVYSTYLGGSNFAYGQAIAVGPKGNAFVTGVAQSMDFPTVNPEQAFFAGYAAIFISELATDGSSLVYSTYLSGSSGGDRSYSIAVDSAGNAYVAGQATSTDFPVKNALSPTLNGFEDGFVTKLSPGGNSLVYSTYLGGSGYDQVNGIAVDAGRNAYVAGYTSSSDFPVTAGAYQTSYNYSEAFVTKLNPSGSALVWSTYLGQKYSVLVNAIAVDSQGNAYLTGRTSSLPVTAGAPQPVLGGNYDAFIAKLNNTGTALSYATYLGGSQFDYGNAIAVDSGGNAYVTGITYSTDLPVTTSAVQPHSGGGADGFVAKVNNLGTEWQYVTYLGGQRDDYAYGIAVDSAGNATVAGYTLSNNFPHPGAVQPALAGNPTLLFKTTSSGSSWGASDVGLPAVNQLAVDPASGAHLIAATNDGLYRSSDSGAHWLPTGPAQVPFQSVSIAPPGTSGGSRAYASSMTSIYSSSDDGGTWVYAGNFSNCYYSNGNSIAVDPAAPTTLYVVAGSCSPSAAKSTDGGVTWTGLTGFPSGAGVYYIAINPKSPNMLYAASNVGVLKSTDGGQTWNLVFAGYTTSVVIDPKQPAIVYAVINGQVCHSTNRGASWQPTGGGINGGVNSLAVAPSNPAILYAGTNSGVFTTSVSGASWSPAGLAQDDVQSVAVDPKKPGTVYAAAYVADDGFVAKINPTGEKLVYSTYLGGTGLDYANSVALNSAGDALVTGYSTSPDFPSTDGAFQPATGSYRYIAFVARISAKTPACTYTSSPGSYFFYQGGGAVNFSVVAPSGCAWTPTPSGSWITIQRHGGPGVGPLAISVASNTGAARTGTIAIGTGSIAITQAASGCSYALSTDGITFPQTGGPASIGVTAGTGCDWVVTNLPDWLTVTSGVSGTGNGTVNLQAAANPFPGARNSYSVLVAGDGVSLSQTGTSGAGVEQPTKPSAPTQPGCPGPPFLCPAPAPPPSRP